MITEWLMHIWTGIVEWISSLLPDDDPPAFLTGIGDALGFVVGSAAGLGAWVPWPLMGTVAAIILTLWTVLVSIKGIRWLWGLTPFSGGS